MLLYYITDRAQLGGRDALLERIAAAAQAGVDYVQLRERDLPARQLEALAAAALRALAGSSTRLLINSRSDVAIAAGAHGVHLRSDDVAASDARAIFQKAGVARPVIAVSCHTPAEVGLAEAHVADLVVFGPVFEKSGARGQGLAALRAACRRPRAFTPPVPVLALGGVSLANAQQCLRAGAAGVAGIRLFQEGDLEATVRNLRRL